MSVKSEMAAMAYLTKQKPKVYRIEHNGPIITLWKRAIFYREFGRFTKSSVVHTIDLKEQDDE